MTNNVESDELKLSANSRNIITSLDSVVLLAFNKQKPHEALDLKEHAILPDLQIFDYLNLVNHHIFQNFFGEYQNKDCILGLSQTIQGADQNRAGEYKTNIDNARELLVNTNKRFKLFFDNIAPENNILAFTFVYDKIKNIYMPHIIAGSNFLSGGVKRVFYSSVEIEESVSGKFNMKELAKPDLSKSDPDFQKVITQDIPVAKTIEDDDSVVPEITDYFDVDSDVIPTAEQATPEDIEELEFETPPADTTYLDSDADKKISKVAASVKNDSERFLGVGDLDENILKKTIEEQRSSIVDKEPQKTKKMTKKDTGKPYSINISPRLEKMLLGSFGYGYILTDSVELAPKVKVFDASSLRGSPKTHKTLETCILKNLVEADSEVEYILTKAKESKKVPILYLCEKSCTGDKGWSITKGTLPKIYEKSLRLAEKIGTSPLNLFAYVLRKGELKFRNVIKDEGEYGRNKVYYEVIPIPEEALVDDAYNPLASSIQAVMDANEEEVNYGDEEEIQEAPLISRKDLPYRPQEDDVDSIAGVQERITPVVDKLLDEESKKDKDTKEVLRETEIKEIEQADDEKIKAETAKIEEMYQQDHIAKAAKPILVNEEIDPDTVPVEASIKDSITKDTAMIDYDKNEISKMLDTKKVEEAKAKRTVAQKPVYKSTKFDQKEKLEVKSMKKDEKTKVQPEKLKKGSMFRKKEDLEEKTKKETVVTDNSGFKVPKAYQTRLLEGDVKKSRIKRLMTWPFRKTGNYIKSIPKQLLHSLKWVAAGLVVASPGAVLYFTDYEKEVKEGIEKGLNNFENAAIALFDGERLDDCIQILVGEETDYSLIQKARKNLAEQSKKIAEQDAEYELKFNNMLKGKDKKIKEQEGVIDRKFDRILELEKELAKAELKAPEIAKVYDKLKQEYNALESTYDNLKTEKDTLVKEKDSLEENVKVWEEKYKNKEVENKKQIKDLSEKQKREYNIKVGELNKKLETKESEYETQIKELTEKHKDEKTELKTKLDQLKKTHKSDKEGLEEEINKLTEKYQIKEADLNKQLDDLTKNYKKEETVYKNQITDLNKKITSLDGKIQSLEKVKKGLVLTDESLKYFARTEYSLQKIRRLFKAVENKVDPKKFPKLAYAYSLKEDIEDKYSKKGLVKPEIMKSVLDKLKSFDLDIDKTLEYFFKESEK